MEKRDAPEKRDASVELEAIRKKSGLAIEEFAERAGMKPGKYRHYEDRFKGAYLPIEVGQAIADGISDMPDLAARVLALIDPLEFRSFAEPASVYSAIERGKRLLARIDAPTDGPPIMISTDGQRIQVTADVDADGIDRLIARLEIARRLLD